MKRKSTLLMVLLLLWILVAPNSTWGAGGDLLWQKSFNFSPTYPIFSLRNLAVSSTLCIVYGTVRSGSSNVSMGFIKVYDMATGNLKWERTLTLGNYMNYFGSIVIDGNMAYINSYSESASGSPPITTWKQSTLGAYDANTGQILWEKISDYGLTMSISLPVPLVNNRIFALTSNSNNDIVLQVYQAKDVNSPAVNSFLLMDK